ncbi:uncharacterized protein LOC120194316 [Hibiscus syriacus]|uniref:uncharacterized protein LOC120194316 n=1 Tax=Hibiscus syriacus TaxID=106335 RepID=UPI0019213AB8|nr:uncharacterized protein LOC120194316 [Hibiscus syriacus]
MGSKLHFDITLSRRTRKPLNDPQPPKSNDKESENEDHKSLKQLINGDETGGNKTSMGRHFSEEEQHLQLVKKNHNYNNGIKLKGMLSRYAKVLSHLVKVKREPSLGAKKKHLLRLTNVG